MSEKDQEEPQSSSRRGGVFVTEGARLVIPRGGLTLRLSDEGEIEPDPIVLHVGLDTCPYWLEIATAHVWAAAEVNEDLKQAVDEEDAERSGQDLQHEFISGMQAIVAAAVAIDALYAAIKERIDLPEGLIDTWRTNRTARHAQIFEVFSRAVEIDNKNAETIREILRELMRFRGQAVHPAGDARAAAYHPDLKRGTEWRFVAFGYPNAQKAVRLALALVTYIAGRPVRSSEQLRTYLASLLERVEPHRQKWEDRYGSVFKGEDAGN